MGGISNLSENKGIEPESVESGIYGNRWFTRELLFVGSERSNAVGIYEMKHGRPHFLQLLPTGIGPEGLKAIPGRGLFVASTEKDESKNGIPTMINIFKLHRGKPYYPMVTSMVEGADIIPWCALSGLAGHPTKKNLVYAVSDSFLTKGFIYTIDVSSRPAVIKERIEVTGASSSLDLEGIAIGPDGSFWLASEGKPGTRNNAILKVDPEGSVLLEIALPEDLEDEARKNGFEGIAVTGSKGEETVFVAIQRAWPKEGDRDKVNTKIGRYDVTSESWGFVHYPLEPELDGGWIGLSELTLLPNGYFAVIERDKGWGNSTGLNANLKAIYGIDLQRAEFRPYTEELVTIEKKLLRDLLPTITKKSIWTAEKLEGLAVTANGGVYIVTDNDGVDDAPGETLFLKIGKIKKQQTKKRK